MLHEREQKVKDYMERRFIPYLDDLFRRSDPMKYQMYQGNFCRQAAIFGQVLLEELLPEYKWTAYEASFNDRIQGQPVSYEHAWIFGVNQEKNRNLLIDLTRNYRQRLFVYVEENQYPKEHPEYTFMQEIERRKIDIPDRMEEQEFYTGIRGKRIVEKIKKATKFEQISQSLNSK